MKTIVFAFVSMLVASIASAEPPKTVARDVAAKTYRQLTCRARAVCAPVLEGAPDPRAYQLCMAEPDAKPTAPRTVVEAAVLFGCTKDAIAASTLRNKAACRPFGDPNTDDGLAGSFDAPHKAECDVLMAVLASAPYALPESKGCGPEYVRLEGKAGFVGCVPTCEKNDDCGAARQCADRTGNPDDGHVDGLACFPRYRDHDYRGR